MFWVLVWATAYVVSPGRSWHWFDTGARALMAGGATGGLHVYHSHPELQIGPVSFVAAIPFTALSQAGARTAAAIVMSAAVVVVLGATMRLLPRHERGRVLLPGLLLIPVWEELAAGAGHLDDVLALTFGALAVAVLRGRHPLWAAVLLALAVDAKPWAVGFVVLLLVAPRGRRLIAFGTWAAVVAAAWLPFVIADPGSVTAAGFRIANAAGSALRAIGVSDPMTPAWCRPAQLGLGLLVAWWCWRRHRPMAVILAVIAVRMLLDPATWTYYTAGLLVATTLVDLSRAYRRWELPWFTIGAFVMVFLPAYVHVGPLTDDAVHGALRATFLVVAVGAALLFPGRDLSSPADSRSSHALARRVDVSTLSMPFRRTAAVPVEEFR